MRPCVVTVNPKAWVHVSKCTAGVPPARGRLAGREDEGGRDARGTLWATHLLKAWILTASSILYVGD
ncbi:MAG: hypothetical protein ABSE73_29720 [Planctomycetota bacterium]